MELKFGDPESIKYKKAKGIQNLEVGEHQCDCEMCDTEFRCPHCGSMDEPSWPDSESEPVFECYDCDKKSFTNRDAKRRIVAFIKNFESNN